MSPIAGQGSAFTQTSFGGASFSPHPINPGQSFSTVSALTVGPSTVAFGSMGAGYGGSGQPLTYTVAANLIVNAKAGAFSIDLIAPTSIGAGFNSATFQILSNGNVVESRSFTSLAAADAFFSNNLISVPVKTGLDNIQLGLTETLTSGQGFGFKYAAASSGFKGVPGPTAGQACLCWLRQRLGLIGCCAAAESRSGWLRQVDGRERVWPMISYRRKWTRRLIEGALDGFSVDIGLIHF